MFMVPYILVIRIYIFDCESDEMHADFLCIIYYTVDRAVSVRVSQPQPAPMDYPTSNTP
jgi:hypothetical protein